MQAQLISHNPVNTRLILIFSGWSTTPEFYSDLRSEGWDIMLVYDYSDSRFDIPDLSGYSTIFVLAWSLGVAAAESVATSGRLGGSVISAAFAVNGTTFPADDMRGIPVAVYDGTERNLSLKNLRRFRRRMAEPPVCDASFMLDSDSDEDSAIYRLRSELRRLRSSYTSPLLPWLRVYVGTEDRIFPAANQLTAWRSMPVIPQIVQMQEGHHIPLQKIISEITPDHTRIAGRFRRAVDTYDRHAIAQERIVGHLMSLLPDRLKDSDNLSLIEIGAGSGRLTRALGEVISPAEAIFVDLYPLPKFGIAENEEYVEADAEEWLDNVA